MNADGLRTTDYRLQSTVYGLRQEGGLQLMAYGPDYGLRTTVYRLRSTGYEVRVQNKGEKCFDLKIWKFGKNLESW